MLPYDHGIHRRCRAAVAIQHKGIDVHLHDPGMLLYQPGQAQKRVNNLLPVVLLTAQTLAGLGKGGFIDHILGVGPGNGQHPQRNGVEQLHGGTYTIIPDQIEAGTYMAAAAAVGGNVLIENIIPKHLDCITAKLREMGARVTEYDDSIRVESTKRLRRANVKTLPYPGFPTDMQPQIAVCMALAEGTSLVTEGIYDNRFRYTGELNRMGAAIQVESKTAVIDGVAKLHGCEVRACDLRAGAAMVIAALAADGTSTIEDAHYIERGYEDIVGKFAALGARIRRVETQEPVHESAAG